MSDFKKDPLELLRKKQPNDLQMHRWQIAVQSQVPTSGNGSGKWWSWSHLLQLAVATGVGVILGAFIFGSRAQQPDVIENSYDNATMEVIYTNLN